jgi:anti-anti-sigma regulatory factor
MRIERLDGEVGPVFRLHGRLEGLACRHLLRVLNGPASDGTAIAIDLRGLDACDTKGAEALIALTKRAHVAGGRLILRAAPECVLGDLDRAGALCDLQLAPAETVPDDRHTPRRVLRYLTRVGEEQPFAYAANRRDFYLVCDDSLWAHESHDWLLEAHSGAALAHRTRGAYYDLENGQVVFVETAAPTTTDVVIDLSDAGPT